MGPLPTPLPTSAPSSDEWVISVNGLIFTFFSSANEMVINSQTLVPGGLVATVSGTRIILDATKGLHVGSSLIYLPTPAPGSVGVVFTAGELEFTSLSSANGVVVNGQTLAVRGLPITISGKPIRLDPTEGLHVGYSLIALPTQVPSPGKNAVVFIARGLKFTSLPCLRVAIDGQTLAPGGSPVTVSGSRISLDSTGGLRVGSWLIAHSNPPAPGSAGVEIYFNAGSTLSRLLPHLVVVSISGTTIFPSSATTATISGTPGSMSLLDDPICGTLLNFFQGKTTTNLVFSSSSSSSPTATGSNSPSLGVFLSGQGNRTKGSPHGWLVGVVSGISFLIYWI